MRRGPFSLNFYPPEAEQSSSCDWRWILREWGMSHREGVANSYDGELTEEGRQIILERFGLKDIADELPLEKLKTKSPTYLMRQRRILEQERALPRLPEVQSDQLGHRKRELAAA